MLSIDSLDRIENKLRKIISLYWQLVFLPIAALAYLPFGSYFLSKKIWLLYTPGTAAHEYFKWIDSTEIKLVALIAILIVFSLIIMIISLFKMRKTENKVIYISTIIFIDLLFSGLCILMKLRILSFPHM